MNSIGWTIFDTKIGTCGLAWNKSKIIQFQLPNRRLSNTRNKLITITGQTTQSKKTPSWITELIHKVTLHCSGEPQDFSSTPIALEEVTEFRRLVYVAATNIPSGQIRTYQELAKAIGKPNAARAVGQALGKNPFPLLIPCHRIIATGRKPGGFSAYGGLATKSNLLACEGLALNGSSPLLKKSEMKKSVQKLAKTNQTIAKLVRQVGSIKFNPKKTQSSFQTLFEAIVHQQIHPQAAKTILTRINTHFSRFPIPQEILNAKESDLKALGISQGKMKAIKDLSRKTLDQVVPSIQKLKTMSNEEIIECLTMVHGIGRWTVEMFLIFNLGRSNVFPIDDFALKKAMMNLYGLEEFPTPKKMYEFGKTFRPHQTLIALYLWRSLA